MNKLFLSLFFLYLFCTKLVLAEEAQKIRIAYIAQEQKVPAALSNLDAFIQFKGMKGAEIALNDNNTTGQFTGQSFELITITVPVDGDVVKVFSQQQDNIAFIVSNLEIEQLKRLTEYTSTKNSLIFDATTIDDVLRNEGCKKNVLHILPSRAMRADALAQYMMKKRWNKWFLVTGMTQADQLYAKALQRAAIRFGMKIVNQKQWTHTYDARRTAQSDVAVFTQGKEYDVLVVADEKGLFGEYLEYRTWIPRPIIGTQGLVPTSWHRTHEQWGAVQIQNRFKEQTGRWMEEQDYAAYLAVRAIGEAAVRTKSAQMGKIKDYLLGNEFALQGYKGKPLSFRPWNGQLRQPVLLSAARSLVSVAPIEGFLHPITELDTLGYDQSESSCMNQSKKNQSILPVPVARPEMGIVDKLQALKQYLINKFKQFEGK